MSTMTDKANLLIRVRNNPALAARGIRAEMVGRHSIKVSQDGRYVGIWREILGSLEWYPAGATQAQVRAFSSDEAAGHLAQIFAAH